MTTAILSAVILLSPGTSNADACQMMTIPELIERLRPNPVERYVTAELVAIPFEDVVSKAELVIEGRVRLLKTYLGEDQCYLYTDFEVTAPVVIWGNLALPRTPGDPPPLVVTQTGGSMVIDGVKVIVENQQLRPFTSGQRVVLLLSRSAPGGSYNIAGHAFGAFIVEADDRVRPVLREKGIYDDLQNLTKTDFVERVRRAKGPR